MVAEGGKERAREKEREGEKRPARSKATLIN